MMLKINEYFDGQVKSISFRDCSGHATVGVMAPGEYRFSTSAPELMIVVLGELAVKLPGSDKWVTYNTSEQFEVPGNSAFELQVERDTAYLCLYR